MSLSNSDWVKLRADFLGKTNTSLESIAVFVPQRTETILRLSLFLTTALGDTFFETITAARKYPRSFSEIFSERLGPFLREWGIGGEDVMLFPKGSLCFFASILLTS